MRNLTGMLIVITLCVGALAAETSAADADIENLKDKTKACYVALTVDKGDTLLLRNVQVYAPK
ncbi:MAG: hypothetical protein ACLFWL_17440 [Candidatus Brocadiia bacterium]